MCVLVINHRARRQGCGALFPGRRTASRTSRVQGNERQRPPIVSSERASRGSKTKDICEAVKAGLGFDPLIDAADITIKNMNGDAALDGSVPDQAEATASDGNLGVTGTARCGSRHKAGVGSAGPNGRTGCCSR